MTAALSLERTNRTSGAGLAVADGYIADPSGAMCFNGGGTVDATGAEASLDVDGGGFAMGGRFWMGAGAVNAGARSSDVVQLFGLPGIDSTGVATGLSLQVAHIDQATANWQLQLAIAGGDTIAMGAAGHTPTDPFPAVLTFVRKWGGCLVTLYIAGTLIASTQLTLAQVPIPGNVRYGDLYKSDGGFSHVAFWHRVLEADETNCTFDCLKDLPTGGGGDGSCDPLLKTDGTTAINPDFPVPRQDGAGRTIVDEGPHRWTRNPHETVVRVYTLPFNLGDPTDVELLRQALEVTRGGTTWTRWRHPIDDAPGPVATAPRYRITNAGDAALAIERNVAGQSAKFNLTLESLEL